MPHETPKYYLGTPVWSCVDWIGTVFDARIEKSHLLREFSKIFTTVEANSLFYALPPMSTIEKWMAETNDRFRFAPKFPKAISHERRLVDADGETKAFIKALEALQHGNRLGTSFLQLSPSLNINNFDTLESYLKGLPRDFRYAVEPRHISWFDNADNESKLDDLLSNLGIDKVVFDSRPLFSSSPSDEDEERAQSRKPQNPVRKTVTGDHPFLRFVGMNRVEANDPWIKEWAPVINKWILEGKKPYIFVHAADEAKAPYLARNLHEQLRKINPLLPALPEFESDKKHIKQEEEQLDLF